MKHGDDDGVAHTFSTLSPFRYPGGKSWLRKRVIDWLEGLPVKPQLFLEPFAGGASISLAVAELEVVPRVLIVERDPAVAAVWRVIFEGKSDRLIQKITRFQLSLGAVVDVLTSDEKDDVSVAFRCLLRNRVSRGGIIAAGAGILRKGEDGRGLGSRWYPQTLAARIRKIRGLSDRVLFLEGDALEYTRSHARRQGVAFFLDPPYTNEDDAPGQRLYRFSSVDHAKLFGIIANAEGPALMTYHSSPEILALARKHEFAIRRIRMRTAHHKSRYELLIEVR